MAKTKFNGILKEIAEQNPVDLPSLLEEKLQIPLFKAEELAQRIQKQYSQKGSEDAENTLKVLFEKPDRGEPAPEATDYAVESLSGSEFRRFVKWLFKTLDYDVQAKEHLVEWGIDFVAVKEGTKILVQARKIPKNRRFSEAAIAVTHPQNGLEYSRVVIVATSYFSQQAHKLAQEKGVELWDRDTLADKIKEAKQKNETAQQICLPLYREGLFESLMQLGKSRDFIIESRNDEKYELYLAGVKYPLLTFQVIDGKVVRCVFRIKFYKPVGEFDVDPLISTSEQGRFGPSEHEAYSLIVEYLEQFLD